MPIFYFYPDNILVIYTTIKHYTNELLPEYIVLNVQFIFVPTRMDETCSEASFPDICL